VAHGRTAHNTAILSVARSRADCEAVSCGGSEVSPSAAFATLRPSLHVRGPGQSASPTDFGVPRTLGPLRRRCLTRASWPHHPVYTAVPSPNSEDRSPLLGVRVSLTESNRREVRARTLSRVGARTNVEPRLSPYLVHATDQFTLFLLAK